MGIEHYKGNLLSTIDERWGKFFEVQVTLTVTNIENEWENVFQFTTNSSDICKGCRVPALYVNKAKYFHITTESDENLHFYNDYPLEYGQTYTIKIMQTPYEYEEALYKIFINGVLKRVEIIHAPQDYDNVKVYATVPTKPSFSGFIQDFHWKKLMPETHEIGQF